MSETDESPFVGRHRLPSGRHGVPRTFIVESQRDRIVAAMVNLCAIKGYSQLSIADLARGAGISKSTFYKHFRDKEACFLETYDTVTGLFVTDTLTAYATDLPDWPEQFLLAVEMAFGYMADHPQEAKVSTVDVMIAGPVAMERYSAARRMLATNFDNGRSFEGVNSDVPVAMASAVISGGAQLIRRMLLTDRAAELPLVAPDYIRWGLTPYIGVAEANKWSEEARRRLQARADEKPGGERA